jgi:2-dehydropantoate 2-reductase
MKNEDNGIDLVILTVKAYGTINAAKKIRNACSAPILSLQNGIKNEEIIEKIVGEKRTIGGITTHGVRYISPGKIRHTGMGNTIIGEMDGSVSKRIKKFASAFSECGIETTISSNIRKEIWRKAIVNASINPLTAILRCRNGYLLDNKHAKKLMECICREAVMVSKSAGMDPGDEIIKKVEEVACLTRENYSSMLQSIIRNKKTEIDHINGEIVKIGRKNGIETPINSTLVAIIKAMEK